MKSIRDCSCQDFLLAKRTWQFFPCSIAAKNSMGNFAAVQPAVIFKQGHCCVLTLILYFHLVSMLIHPMFFFWYLVLYAYTVYKYIYIFHIFLYLCLLLSWEWCDYVISLWSLIILMLTYSHLQWDNYSPNLSLLCEYLKSSNNSSQHIYCFF